MSCGAQIGACPTSLNKFARGQCRREARGGCEIGCEGPGRRERLACEDWLGQANRPLRSEHTHTRPPRGPQTASKPLSNHPKMPAPVGVVPENHQGEPLVLPAPGPDFSLLRARQLTRHPPRAQRSLPPGTRRSAPRGLACSRPGW